MIRHIPVRWVLALGLSFGFAPFALSAQTNPEDIPAKPTEADTEVYDHLLQEVFPDATRFDPRSGTPPVWRAYTTNSTGQEVLAGFVFLTSDLPPEEKGYSAPIRVLVGMDMGGKITGTRVTYYVESLRSSRGDFLRGFYQEQFTGKRMTDRFLVRRDIETVSGATITAAAAARGIRNASRRVAAAYLIQRQETALTAEDMQRMTWPEMEMRGLTEQLIGVDGNVLKIHLSLVPIADSTMGRLLLGNDGWNRAVQRLGRAKVASKRPWAVGVDGTIMMLFRGPQLSVIRGQDTLKFAMGDLSLIGDPREGKMSGQFRNVGVLLADSTLDPKQNFRWEMNFGSGIPIYSLQHIGDPVLYAQENPPPPPPAAAPAEVTADAADAVPADTQERPPEVAAADSNTATVAAVPAEPAAPLVDPAFDPALFGFEEEQSQSVLARTLETTSWPLVGVTAFILLVTTAAFFAKIIWLRWLALALTLAVLGFAEGDFLSVSHITAAIKVGPSVFLEDIPLLLLVAFTIVTTLLWGRVFCGYLCPFGALQDFMERVIPKKWRRKLPHPVHESGQWIKYGVLAVILIPAILGSQTSTFQYFEPFGTVFFWSRSTVLWLIAGGILVASAIIPRFYCRYACPLGASLALASTLSPFRIKRVPHCTLCTVCEHTCPTGAIKRESIDFRECVRCNECEVKLKTTAGVCKHDIDRVSQLIQLKRTPRFNPMPEAAGD
jgi:Na+-translocating ferredoxin:NAD+ oxidoreductase RnfG subunit